MQERLERDMKNLEERASQREKQLQHDHQNTTEKLNQTHKDELNTHKQLAEERLAQLKQVAKNYNQYY